MRLSAAGVAFYGSSARRALRARSEVGRPCAQTPLLAAGAVCKRWAIRKRCFSWIRRSSSPRAAAQGARAYPLIQSEPCALVGNPPIPRIYPPQEPGSLKSGGSGSRPTCALPSAPNPAKNRRTPRTFPFTRGTGSSPGRAGARPSRPFAPTSVHRIRRNPPASQRVRCGPWRVRLLPDLRPAARGAKPGAKPGLTTWVPGGPQVAQERVPPNPRTAPSRGRWGPARPTAPLHGAPESWFTGKGPRYLTRTTTRGPRNQRFHRKSSMCLM